MSRLTEAYTGSVLACNQVIEVEITKAHIDDSGEAMILDVTSPEGTPTSIRLSASDNAFDMQIKPFLDSIGASGETPIEAVNKRVPFKKRLRVEENIVTNKTTKTVRIFQNYIWNEKALDEYLQFDTPSAASSAVKETKRARK